LEVALDLWRLFPVASKKTAPTNSYTGNERPFPSEKPVNLDYSFVGL
jgi:hypothetical protein